MGGSCTTAKPKQNQNFNIAIKSSAENLVSFHQDEIQIKIEQQGHQQQEPQQQQQSQPPQKQILNMTKEQSELRKSILKLMRERGSSCLISAKQTDTTINGSSQPTITCRPQTQHVISQNPSYMEMFLIERKKYMQEKGILSYTAYTILPAPKLKSRKASALFQRRIQSLATIPPISCTNISEKPPKTPGQSKHAHEYMSATIQSKSHSDHSNIHKESYPVIQPNGDELNYIEIELDF